MRFRYNDNEYEYRHVQIPKQMLKVIPAEYHDKAKGTLKLLWEEEWRAMGITQSLGWEHYEVHEPEPHILLFKYVCPSHRRQLRSGGMDANPRPRRPLNYQPPAQ